MVERGWIQTAKGTSSIFPLIKCRDNYQSLQVMLCKTLVCSIAICASEILSLPQKAVAL
jgi:hypothetical protein